MTTMRKTRPRDPVQLGKRRTDIATGRTEELAGLSSARRGAKSPIR